MPPYSKNLKKKKKKEHWGGVAVVYLPVCTSNTPSGEINKITAGTLIDVCTATLKQAQKLMGSLIHKT